MKLKGQTGWERRAKIPPKSLFDTSAQLMAINLALLVSAVSVWLKQTL